MYESEPSQQMKPTYYTTQHDTPNGDVRRISFLPAFQ